MITINQLYERARKHDIQIFETKTRELRAVSFPGFIFMDCRKFSSMTEYKCILAHEIGHCETGSFYNIYSPFDLRAKCERRADKRAIEILMPYEEVYLALQRGCRNVFSLAKQFEVTEDYARKAIDLYADRLHGYDEFERLTVPKVKKPLQISGLVMAKDIPQPARTSPEIQQNAWATLEGMEK